MDAKITFIRKGGSPYCGLEIKSGSAMIEVDLEATKGIVPIETEDIFTNLAMEIGRWSDRDDVGYVKRVYETLCNAEKVEFLELIGATLKSQDE
jgi:hypothetical protein